MQNYYKSYDKNIISQRGGGEILQGKGVNIENREKTISSRLKNDVNYMPPLFRITERSDSIKTNAYINPNNYVEKDGDIEDYYYSAQQINNMNIINNSISKEKKNELNMGNPIKSPPPLISSYMSEKNKNKEIIEEEIKEEIMKEKKREKIKERLLKKIKEELIRKEIEKNKKIESDLKKEISQKEKESELKKIEENIGKNMWINENYLYSVKSNSSENLPWKNKECIINLSNNSLMTDNCREKKVEENFRSKEGKENTEIDYSIIIFVTLILTIIIVYITLKYKE